MIQDKIEVNIAGGLDIDLPRMIRVRQKFDCVELDDVTGTVVEQLKDPAIRERIKPGMRIAIGCGSRGIANVAECVLAVITELKSLGAEPFIFPAMGSHGSASAEGQIKVLADLGISEEAMGCPVKSSMDVVQFGELDNGMPVYFDKHAAEADAVALVCRIKAHTNFRAPIESGICKMLVIGAGKIMGASATHALGFDSFEELLPAAAEHIMQHVNFLFGVAMVENAEDHTALVEVVPSEKVLEREPDLLTKSREWMPKLQFDDIDVLLIDKIGKNITGAGADPNITGRNARGMEWDVGPDVTKIVILGLTAETDGNASGVGMADVITMRLYKAFDAGKTYANVIAATLLDGACIPMIMNTDKEALQLAVKTVLRKKPMEVSIVHIPNTLEITTIDVSENLLPYIEENPDLFEVVGELQPFDFDEEGTLTPMPSHITKSEW